MKKLLDGIIDFRQNVRPKMLELFASLADHQSPDTLMIACSDSRVVPNLFASTNPGDLFVVRNVGNIIPPDNSGLGPSSEAAAIGFALNHLPLRDIIICGHSDCGAMRAIHANLSPVKDDHVHNWLSRAKQQLKPCSHYNELSQENVLQQIENLKSYNRLNSAIKSGEIRVHAWYFDVTEANVYYFDNETKKFELMTEVKAREIQSQL